MNQREYAARRGVSQQAVSKAVHAGKIPVTDGKIDADVADAVWHVRSILTGKAPAASPVAPASAPTPAPDAAVPSAAQQPAFAFALPPAGTPASEQAALARARREKIELDMAAQRGDLVPLREVERAWAAMVIAVRDRLEMIPDSIVDATVRAQVLHAIREACLDLSRLQIDLSESAAA